MKNKVLVKIIVPELDYSFDAFLYVNELVWKTKKMLLKSIYDLTGGAIDMKKEYVLINKITEEMYDNNKPIIETDIRNSTELLIIALNRE